MLGPLVIGLPDKVLTRDDESKLKHPSVGGVILFARNFESLDQLTALISDIKKIRSPQLLIMVDHEGGRVQRFNAGFTQLTAIGESIARKPFELAQQIVCLHAQITAFELSACGVDMPLMPVVDINNSKSKVLKGRCLGDAIDVITQLTMAYCHGLKAYNMSATAKHFPGHGAVEQDTHTEYVNDHRPINDVKATDLKLYQQLIETGIDSIMVSHIRYPQFEPKPASSSVFWVQQILRKELGFKGVILSDDMGMKAALEDGHSLSEQCANAYSAGCDLIILGNDFDAIESILSANILSANASRQKALRQLWVSPSMQWGSPAFEAQQARYQKEMLNLLDQ